MPGALETQVVTGFDADHRDVALDGNDAKQLSGDSKEHLAAEGWAFDEVERARANTGRNIKEAGSGDTKDDFGDRQPALGVDVNAGEGRIAKDAGDLGIDEVERIERAGPPEEDRAGKIVAVEAHATFECQVIFVTAEGKRAGEIVQLKCFESEITIELETAGEIHREWNRPVEGKLRSDVDREIGAHPIERDVGRTERDFRECPRWTGATRRAIRMQFLDFQEGIERHAIRGFPLEMAVQSEQFERVAVDESVSIDLAGAHYIFNFTKRLVDG